MSIYGSFIIDGTESEFFKKTTQGLIQLVFPEIEEYL